MAQIEIVTAAADLRALIDLADAGETVEFIDSGRVVARLVPVEPENKPAAPRVLGRLEGQFTIPEDFDAPLPDDLLALFYEGPIFPDETSPTGSEGDGARRMKRQPCGCFSTPTC